MEKLTHCLLCGSNRLVTIDTECNISRCEGCGYVFDNPRPLPQEIAVYYSRPAKYDGWLTAKPERELLWRRRLQKLLRHRVSGELLDIGTGIGQFLNVARPHFRTLTGTEVSTSAARIAQEQYGLNVINAALEHIDFDDRQFDTITLFHVLEHVHDPVAVVTRSHALLREGGVLLVAVPNELQAFRQHVRGFLQRLGLLKGKFHGKLGLAPLVLDGSLDEIHLSHFTPSVLADLFQRHGFRVLENGLDPYFVAKGINNVSQLIYYVLMSLIWKLTGQNYYDTIWLVAKKQSTAQKEGI
jgi:SAM-dependent methyltransferase